MLFRSIDATELYTGGVGWPADYIDAQGRPILPYVLYHRRVGDHLRDGNSGAEAISGTLNVSALWTFWLMGVRDGAHPQRYIIDGFVPVTARLSPDKSTSQDVVRLNPQTILPIQAIPRPDGTYSGPSAGQFNPAIDPKTAGEAIESYANAIAVNAGLSPADVHRGSANSSGYAIVVSQKGRRDAQRKLMPPSRYGDQLLLAKAAAILKDASLPTDPQAYQIAYVEVGTAPEEEKAQQEVIKGDLELGLISKREAIRRRNPQLTQSGIDALIAEIEGADAEEDAAEEMPDEDAALSASVADALTALEAGDFTFARASLLAAQRLLGEDQIEDAAEEEDAADMPEGSDPGGNQTDTEEA